MEADARMLENRQHERMDIDSRDEIVKRVKGPVIKESEQLVQRRREVLRHKKGGILEFAHDDSLG